MAASIVDSYYRNNELVVVVQGTNFADIADNTLVRRMATAYAQKQAGNVHVRDTQLVTIDKDGKRGSVISTFEKVAELTFQKHVSFGVNGSFF